MVNWKAKLRVSDLGDDARLELQCRRCGQVRYLTYADLTARHADQLYLDQVEARARCRVKGCNGLMRLAMMHKNQTSGFVGGMA